MQIKWIERLFCELTFSQGIILKCEQTVKKSDTFNMCILCYTFRIIYVYFFIHAYFNSSVKLLSVLQTKQAHIYLPIRTVCYGKINIKKKRNNNDERWWKNIHNLRIIWHCVCLCLCLYLQKNEGNFGRWYFLSHSSFSPGSIHTKASFLFFSLVHRKSMLKVYHLSCEIGEWEREREKDKYQV